ncbi:hypothetical protein EDD18DRAFT_1353183 [Armillaria luteobubalina]|uniref:Uncharacterized protein n=1 Tax=Armillaria luteobubalina TaxID=153913 RepID=A0AA39TP47_9AGAR|nr:hypothetical protein EDD18DRAFT_1353183 [Armillaria luteobubalina]
MSSPQAAHKVATAEHPSIIGGEKHVAHTHTHVPAARVPHRKQREALKLRLDLNLEVEIHIQAKVNGDITLSLLVWEQNLARV